MADTVICAKNGSAVLRKILKALGYNTPQAIKRRIWWSASADPAVDAGSQATYPVSVGDLAYRNDSAEPFVCTVAPTANTAATFVQLVA